MIYFLKLMKEMENLITVTGMALSSTSQEQSYQGFLEVVPHYLLDWLWLPLPHELISLSLCKENPPKMFFKTHTNKNTNKNINKQTNKRQQIHPPKKPKSTNQTQKEVSTSHIYCFWLNRVLSSFELNQQKQTHLLHCIVLHYMF